MYQAVYNVLCMVYRQVLRPVLLKAIDDPNQTWDDVLMTMVDGLFNYKG